MKELKPTNDQILAICSNPIHREKATIVAQRMVNEAYDLFVNGRVVYFAEGWEIAMKNSANWVGCECLK